MKKSLLTTFTQICFDPYPEKLASQHLLFYWRLTFLKETAKTFLKFLEFLQVAFSVQWASCTLQDTCKTSKKRGSCHTFQIPFMVSLICFRRTSAELIWNLKKNIWKIITCYSVSLHLSKITLTLLFLQETPGGLNSNSL